MNLLHITEPAAQDLEEIWAYIAQDKPGAASDFIAELLRVFEDVGRLPSLGRSRRDLGPTVRCLPYRAYMIYYRTLEPGVEILRVVHGAREQKNLL